MPIDYKTNFNVYETIKHDPGITSNNLLKVATNKDSFNKSISYLITSGRIYIDHRQQRYYPT